MKRNEEKKILKDVEYELEALQNKIEKDDAPYSYSAEALKIILRLMVIIRTLLEHILKEKK